MTEVVVIRRLCVIAAAFALAACAVLMCTSCSKDVEYQPEPKSPAVFTPTIGQEGVLRVGVNSGSSPLAGLSNGNLVGIDTDIAAYIADELGLELQLVDVENNPEAALDAGTVDIVMGVSEDSESIEPLLTTDEYLPKATALFSMVGSDEPVPTGPTDVRIAAQVSSTSSWAVTSMFDESVLVSTTNLQEAFGLLEEGSVDFVAADIISGLYVAHTQNVDAEMAALLTAPTGYHIAMKPDNNDLEASITSALAMVNDQGYMNLIEEKWLGCTLDLSGVPRVSF